MIKILHRRPRLRRRLLRLRHRLHRRQTRQIHRKLHHRPCLHRRRLGQCSRQRMCQPRLSLYAANYTVAIPDDTVAEKVADHAVSDHAAVHPCADTISDYTAEYTVAKSDDVGAADHSCTDTVSARLHRRPHLRQHHLRLRSQTTPAPKPFQTTPQTSPL